VPPVPKQKYRLNSPLLVTGVDFSFFKRWPTISWVGFPLIRELQHITSQDIKRSNSEHP